jgi:glutathione S-transferase
MKDTLTLYIGEKNISSWSMRPYVALAAKGVPFEERTISLREDKDRSRRRAIGPTGRVPVLHHRRGGGEASGPRAGEAPEPLVVADSLAIIEYIEEAFPPPAHPALWPADIEDRARARSLAATMHSGFAKLRESLSFNLCFLSAPPPASPEGLAEAAEILAMWEDALARKKDPRPFLFGPFGAVDAMYAPAVVRLTAFKVPTGSAPRSAEYMRTALNYPPMKRWLDQARALPPVTSY